MKMHNMNFIDNFYRQAVLTKIQTELVRGQHYNKKINPSL